MTRDEVIRLAREAGYRPYINSVGIWDDIQFVRFAELVVKHEREECCGCVKPNATPMEIVAAIRARSTT